MTGFDLVIGFFLFMFFVVFLLSKNVIASVFVLGVTLAYLGYRLLKFLDDESYPDYYQLSLQHLKDDLRDNPLTEPGSLYQIGDKDLEIDNARHGKVLGVIDSQYMYKRYNHRQYTKRVNDISNGKRVYIILYEKERNSTIFDKIVGLKTQIMVVPFDKVEITLGNVYVKVSSFITVFDIKVPNTLEVKPVAATAMEELFMEEVSKGLMKQFSYVVDKRSDQNVPFQQFRKTSEVDIPSGKDNE